MIQNVPALIKGFPRTQRARQLVLTLLTAALDAVNPHVLIPKALTLEKDTLVFANRRFSLDEYSGVYVIGAGKATGRMTEAIEKLLHNHISNGFIIVPEFALEDYSLDLVQIHPGGHPVPSKASITATQQLLAFIAHIPADALILSAFSGGGSALLTYPTPPVTLQDLQETTRLLLRSGATIHETNTIRKHLSQVKGGQLANSIHPRHHIGLLLSDVIGDQPHVIASGPTLPDPTTFREAAAVLDGYQLWDLLPFTVVNLITSGVEGKIRETPKPNNPVFRFSHHKVIGTNQDACQAALHHALQENWSARILTTTCQGEAREVGKKLGTLAQHLTANPNPQIIIVGSETTVTVQHEGKGGRNTELVAAALPNLQGKHGLVIASLATDGIDGPTDAAGAIADGDSYQQASTQKLSIEQLLGTHETYHLFHALDDLIITGPTHTNVRDITIIIWLGTTS